MTTQKILTVLLVGVGNRGRWPLVRCKPENGWRIVGLVDRVPQHLADARAQTGLPESACFSDLEPALDATRPDAVILCTPTVTHAPFTKLAISRGVAVLTEKGMAPDWATAVDLVNFVRAHRGVFAVAQNYRYDGVSRAVGAALSGEGPHRVEEPFLIDYVQHRVRPQPGTLTYPFASVWDMSCHHFDNLLCWLGPVAEVTAHAYRAAWSAYENPPNTSAFLRFANGVLVNYVHTHDASLPCLRLDVQGRNGALFIRDHEASFTARPDQNFGKNPLQPVVLETPDTESRVLEDFHAYVAEGREPGISGYQNLETMALCELTVRSAMLGRAVRREELDTPPPAAGGAAR